MSDDQYVLAPLPSFIVRKIRYFWWWVQRSWFGLFFTLMFGVVFGTIIYTAFFME